MHLSNDDESGPDVALLMPDAPSSPLSAFLRSRKLGKSFGGSHRKTSCLVDDIELGSHQQQFLSADSRSLIPCPTRSSRLLVVESDSCMRDLICR